MSYILLNGLPWLLRKVSGERIVPLDYGRAEPWVIPPGGIIPVWMFVFLVLIVLRLLLNQSSGDILMVTSPIVPIHRRITTLVLDIPPILPTLPPTIPPRKKAKRLRNTPQSALILLSQADEIWSPSRSFFLFHFRRTTCIPCCDYTLRCTFFFGFLFCKL